MDLLREVLEQEVYPALGCTEPIACAYAATVAAAELGEPVKRFSLRVDPGTYKNGAAVTTPNTGGAKGNQIAAALGASIAQPNAKLEVLGFVTPEILSGAKKLLDAGACDYDCLYRETDFRVEVDVSGKTHQASCVLSVGHTHIERIEKDGEVIFDVTDGSDGGGVLLYRERLKRTDIAPLIELAESIDDEQKAFLQKGVEMNFVAAKNGLKEGRTARQLQLMQSEGFVADDIFCRTKLQVAAAVDGRMAGGQWPVMTSGGSGNQGIVAILTTVMVGRELQVDDERILKSLAVAHLLNAYVKCFVGELSAVCGCSMAASIAAAAAIVYQKNGADGNRIAMAVNNVIGDLSGLICDGAKPGCAMKAVTGVDTAIRSALMAIGGYGIDTDEGLVGRTAEDSIRNLGHLALKGMFFVDPTVLEILREKAARSGRA